MKLRLSLQIMDLALRFKVSEGRCSNIFFCWLQAIAEYFKAFVFAILKHHNTVKFLDCVAPNLSVTYVSQGYTGRISDKALTKDSRFLDEILLFCSIMADKGFNLFDECAGRSTTFIVSPCKRGASQ